MGDEQSRAGIRYASPQIVKYADQVHVGADESLMRAFSAPDAHGMPPIMVGHSEAKVLSLLLRLHRAQRVIEVGTLAGFSAIHMAKVLGTEGHLWTIENEPLHAQVARQNIQDAGLTDRVTVLEADGLTGLDRLSSQGPFDAVFLDADKERYDQYALRAHELLKPGGCSRRHRILFWSSHG